MDLGWCDRLRVCESVCARTRVDMRARARIYDFMRAMRIAIVYSDGGGGEESRKTDGSGGPHFEIGLLCN